METIEKYLAGDFCWVDIIARDLKSQGDFYCKLFGWEMVKQPTDDGSTYAMFQLNGKNVAGAGEMSDQMRKSGVPTVWNTYVNVVNLEETLAKVTEAGGQIALQPMDIMDVGRMAIIVDPTGGTLSLWQAKSHPGCELRLDSGTLCWNELASTDAVKAKEFYEKVFDWTFAQSPHAEGHTYFEILNEGEDQGGIMQMDETWGNIPTHWSAYFSVDDVKASAEKLESLGGKVIVPPFDTPVGPISVVCDSQGAKFSLISLK